MKQSGVAEAVVPLRKHMDAKIAQAAKNLRDFMKEVTAMFNLYV